MPAPSLAAALLGAPLLCPRRRRSQTCFRLLCIADNRPFQPLLPAGRALSDLGFILMGPPGGGKGTIAKRLETDFSVEIIGSGDLIRAEIREGTPVCLSRGLGQLKGEAREEPIKQPIVRTGLPSVVLARLCSAARQSAAHSGACCLIIMSFNLPPSVPFPVFSSLSLCLPGMVLPSQLGKRVEETVNNGGLASNEVSDNRLAGDLRAGSGAAHTAGVC